MVKWTGHCFRPDRRESAGAGRRAQQIIRVGPDPKPPALNRFVHQEDGRPHFHLALKISLPGLVDDDCLGNVAHGDRPFLSEDLDRPRFA